MGRNNVFGGRLVPPALGLLVAAGAAEAAQADRATGGDARETGISESGAGVSGSFITRCSSLWNNPQWQELRRVWRKLDGYETPRRIYGEGCLDPELSGELRSELNGAFSELRAVSEELGLQELEIRLLEILAYDRLDLLSYGTSVPMTRMMPPPVTDQADGLVPVIESRIDTIMELRERGLLDTEESREAFDELRTSAELYFLLHSVNLEAGYTSVLWMERWPMDPALFDSHLDSLRTAFREDFGDQAGEELQGELDGIEEALGETRERFPVLRDMLISLELL